ncbi:hypothetical protein CLV26_104225 [Parapedobacter indicus]|nr:hypothetical protein CLV26_104225 [Parapedobacter indicus]
MTADHLQYGECFSTVIGFFADVFIDSWSWKSFKAISVFIHN